MKSNFLVIQEFLDILVIDLVMPKMIEETLDHIASQLKERLSIKCILSNRVTINTIYRHPICLKIVAF